MKEDSDEKRLQPIYVKLFFEKAFKAIGGSYSEVKKSIFKIDNMPPGITSTLRNDYNVSADLSEILLCFDKKVFLEHQSTGTLGKLHYINPGNPIFDSLIKVVRHSFREEMLKGTVLISPEDKSDYFAFFVKSQIIDNRPSKSLDSIADERLGLVFKDSNGNSN